MASRSLNDLHPELAKAYQKALDIYQKKYPDQPQPFITCTYRSNAEQLALYSQGRETAERVNELRFLAGMLEIAKTEAKKKVTNAKPGTSYHNRYPSQAFDIAFIDSRRKLDWSGKLFDRFYEIIAPLDKRIFWGGMFKSIVDRPHFEIHL